MKRIKTLGEFLRSVDFIGMPIKVWGSDESEPLWTGSITDCPYWIADLELDYSFGSAPIEYLNHMDELDRRSGLSIVVCE